MLTHTQRACCWMDARSEYDAYGFNTMEMVTPFNMHLDVLKTFRIKQT